MPTIAEVRAKYPQYDDMSDDALAGALYSKFYSDMPREEFDAKIGMSPAPAPQAAPAPSAEGRGTILPVNIGKDQGAAGVVREITQSAKSNPLAALNPLPTIIGSYFKGRGIEPALPTVVKEPIDATARGISDDYAPGEEGERQRAQDALTIATAGLTGNVAGRVMGAIPKRPMPTSPSEAPWRTSAREAPQPAPQGPAPMTPQQEALEAAQRRGVEIPRGASENPIVRGVAGVVRDTPVVGSPLVKAGSRAYEQIRGGVKGVSDDLGGGSVEQAGGALSDDINAWVKTLSKDEGDAIFAPVRRVVKNEKSPLSRTGVLIRDLEKEAAESFLDPPAVLNKVRAAADAPGGLTYNGMSRLRSEVGQMLSGEITPEGGMSKPALKRLYGSLSEDMAFLAKKAGGKKGEATWQSANAEFRDKIAARRAALLKIVGSKGDATPAQVVDTLVKMAGSKRGADISRLMLAKKTVGKEAWDALGATVIDNMGAAKDGWSLAKFRTDYSKLDETAKGVLFNAEHKAALDDYFKIGGPFEALERLGNPSGSGRMVAVVTGGVGLATALPLVLKTAAGGYILARILARPMGVKALSRYARAAGQHATRPTPATAQVLEQTTGGLQKVMDDLGIDPDALMPAGAAERRQEAQ